MRRIELVFLWLLLAACGSGQAPVAPIVRSSAEQPASDSIDKAAAGMTLSTFNDSPADSDGVGCFFYADGNDSAEVFASGTDSFVYVKLNGLVTAFSTTPRGNTNTSDTTNNFIDSFRYKDYLLEIKMIQTGKTDGGNSYKGTIILRNKTGKSITINAHGACGC